MTKKEKIQRAEKLAIISDRAKALLIEIINESRGNIAISYNDYIMARLKTSKSTLERAKRELKEAGLLQIIHPSQQRKQKKANIYIIKIKRLIKLTGEASDPDTLNKVNNNYKNRSTRKAWSRKTPAENTPKVNLSQFEILEADKSLIYSKATEQAEKLAKRYFCIIHNDQKQVYNIQGATIPKNKVLEKLQSLDYTQLKQIIYRIAHTMQNGGIKSAYSYILTMLYKGALHPEELAKEENKGSSLSDQEHPAPQKPNYMQREYNFAEIEALLLAN